MKRKLSSILLILTGLFFSASLTAQNFDIPGWRGANRDGRVAGFTAPSSWPGEMTKVWEVPVGLGDASPVMVQDRIWLLISQDSTETVLCLDAATGKTVWKTAINHAPEVTGGARTHPGPRCTPYVSGNKIYTLGAGGVVACHNAKTGKLIWKNESYTDEVPQFFTSASPLVQGKLCIIPLGGKEHGVIVAFDLKSGKEIWKHEGEPTTYSSPILMNSGGEEIIVVQSETDLLGLCTKGTLLWKIPTPTQRMFYNSATPVIDGQNVIVAGSGSGARMLNIQKSGDEYTYKEVWTNSKMGVTFNTPVLKDGYLYAGDARFGSLYCLNARTGETAWADTVKLNRFASTLDLGSVMLNLSGNAQLTFYKPDPSALAILARYKVSETEIYAHPLVAGDKLYIKDKEKLTCWQIGRD